MAGSCKSLTFLKALLHHYHGDTAGNYLSALEGLERQTYDSLPLLRADEEGLKGLFTPEETIKEMHYSWLAPIVEHYPTRVQPLLLTALNQEQRQKIASFLSISLEKSERPESLKNFLLKDLWKQVVPSADFLPARFLPRNELTPLLSLNKSEVIQLIDYLSIYDLADAIRQIVDKSRLKAIITCLEPDHAKFLRSCLRKSPSISFSPLEIESWRGEKAKLYHILHRRGLLRLAKALSGCHEDLLWHLVHRLDTGRGALILKDYSRDEVENVTAQLKQQLFTIMKLMTPEKEVL